MLTASYNHASANNMKAKKYEEYNPLQMNQEHQDPSGDSGNVSIFLSLNLVFGIRPVFAKCLAGVSHCEGMR